MLLRAVLQWRGCWAAAPEACALGHRFVCLCALPRIRAAHGAVSAAGARHSLWLQIMALEGVFASSAFRFFSFLSDILCQVSMLSFVSLHFPLQVPWEDFTSGNHSLKLAKSEINWNWNAFTCTSTFFLWQSDNNLRKVTVTLHYGRINSQDKICTCFI